MSRHGSIHAMLARREELTSVEEIVLIAHLDGCRDCQELAADYDQHARILAPLGRIVPPPSLRENVFSSLESPYLQLPEVMPIRRNSMSRRLRFAVGLLVAATVCVGTAVTAVNAKPHSGLGGTWFHGGILSDPGDAVKYYCIEGDMYSGGTSAYKAPIPGRRCFTSRDKSEAAQGFLPSEYTSTIMKEIAATGRKYGGPAGAIYTEGPAHRCTVGLPADTKGYAVAYNLCYTPKVGWLIGMMIHRPNFGTTPKAK